MKMQKEIGKFLVLSSVCLCIGYFAGKNDFKSKKEVIQRSATKEVVVEKDVVRYIYAPDGNVKEVIVDKSKNKEKNNVRLLKETVVSASDNWLLGISTDNKPLPTFNITVDRKIFRSLYISISMDTHKNILYGLRLSF